MRSAITLLIHILLLPDDVAAKAMAKIKEAMQRISTETSKEGPPERRRLSSDPIRQIACGVEGSKKGTQLVFNDKGVNHSSIFYRATSCGRESTQTLLTTVMATKDIERILKLTKERQICSELLMNFHVYYHDLGAAMADAKACHTALGCALDGGPDSMLCVVYYAEDPANNTQTITYAEKVFLKEPEPKIHANRTSTYVTHLEDDFNAFYVKDCSFLGKPTIHRCEALGVEYATKLKDWTSHSWTTGKRSPHASSVSSFDKGSDSPPARLRSYGSGSDSAFASFSPDDSRSYSPLPSVGFDDSRIGSRPASLSLYDSESDSPLGSVNSFGSGRDSPLGSLSSYGSRRGSSFSSFSSFDSSN
ncbi:hypothetical protein FOZ60_014883 [Perkinsus olseni]|uniref:Uncharacterized protein n=1 Tax=Perkinsus olseni TaxID=32597 RepID=A0A7J6P6F2_PEROL|nr:hypothetical protein FOZ60_014883 [Perkinsus olseni]